MIISNSLKSFIEQKKLEGITMTSIAEKLNISKKTLSNYINGDAYIPLKYLNEISNIFNVSIDYLLGFSNKENYPNSKKVSTLNSKDIGNRILAFRKENKINQKSFAQSINSNIASISRYENGINLILTVSLYQICQKYNLSADYLLGKINEPKYIKKA